MRAGPVPFVVGSPITRTLRILLGALALFAVGYQAYISVGQMGFSGANFFSYFTVLSNIFTGLVLLGFGLSPTLASRLDGVRGAVTLYILITGVLYNALLRGIDVATSAAWLNELLHVVVPLVMVVDWLVVPQTRIVALRTSLSWLLFPLAYLAYSLIRGPVVDWYPYPFVDPTIGGYGRVAIYSVVLAVVMAALAMALAALGAFTSRRRDEVALA